MDPVYHQRDRIPKASVLGVSFDGRDCSVTKGNIDVDTSDLSVGVQHTWIASKPPLMKYSTDRNVSVFASESIRVIDSGPMSAKRYAFTGSNSQRSVTNVKLKLLISKIQGHWTRDTRVTYWRIVVCPRSILERCRKWLWSESISDGSSGHSSSTWYKYVEVGI